MPIDGSPGHAAMPMGGRFGDAAMLIDGGSGDAAVPNGSGFGDADIPIDGRSADAVVPVDGWPGGCSDARPRGARYAYASKACQS